MVGAIIISGGNVDDSGLKKMVHDEKSAIVLAADSGIEACLRLSIVPDLVIGDFDSASERAKSALRHWNVQVIELNPVKDDTDTEAALRLALTESAGDVIIFGGTGTRLDHVLGNISILGLGLEDERRIILQDANNRIYMVNKEYHLKKENQYGDYFSLIPYTTEVTGLTICGAKYNLTDYTMTGFNSLGISNEILEDEVIIRLSSGILIMVESRD